MEVYFDNSATTQVLPEVAEQMMKIMCEDYGNPSSMHQKGVDAEQIEQALGQIDEKERMESALRAAQKAARGRELSSPADRQKVFAALMRRGYDSASAKKAIAALRDQEE